MGKRINPTVQHIQWMMVFYSVDVSGKAGKKKLKYKIWGSMSLSLSFFKKKLLSFCDELRFQENKTREGLKSAYCLRMRSKHSWTRC